MRLNLEPSQCIIIRYSAGVDRYGNPRACYAVKRIDFSDYCRTVAVVEEGYAGFDALVGTLDYTTIGPEMVDGRYVSGNAQSDALCWDRRREWQRRIVADCVTTATEIKRMVKDHAKYPPESWVTGGAS